MSNRIHGMNRTPIYNSWNNMVQRTTPGSATQRTRPNYVGRTRHPDFDTFEGFYAVMGESWFEGATLDRVDNDRGYEPGNCQWIKKSPHMRKTCEDRPGYMHLMSDGQFAVDIARSNGISDKTLSGRIRRGWSVDRAATEPLRSVG